MKTCTSILLTSFSILAILLSDSAFADLAPEDRKDATHTLKGKVKEIIKGGDRRVTVRLETVEVQKGKGVEIGEEIDVLVFGPPNIISVDTNSAEFRQLPKNRQTEALLLAYVSKVTFSGHKTPPKVGQEIQAYIVKRDSKRWEGIYPNWYELLH